MDEENKVNYYAIIPASVRYDKKLKANEKLLYGEITALSNKNGYCYAKNRYFAELYNVSPHTISHWISNLEKLRYVKIEIIKNSKKEIIERRIYINDTPYVSKSTYPYELKDTYPMYENVKENNIKYNKDDLFYFIVSRSSQISNNFYEILERLELLYTDEMLSIFQESKIEVLKDIIYVLYELYNSNFDFLLAQVSRESLLNLYNIAVNYNPENLLEYYKRTIINKYTNNST